MIPVNEPTISDAAKRNVKKALDTGWLSSAGPFVREFETEFAKYLGVKHAVSVTSGTDSFKTVVKVNHPLIHNGFRLYQSSYMADGRGREISVFAVARDPGARLVYLGFLVFGIGLVLIFYLKPFLLRHSA